MTQPPQPHAQTAAVGDDRPAAPNQSALVAGAGMFRVGPAGSGCRAPEVVDEALLNQDLHGLAVVDGVSVVAYVRYSDGTYEAQTQDGQQTEQLRDTLQRYGWTITQELSRAEYDVRRRIYGRLSDNMRVALSAMFKAAREDRPVVPQGPRNRAWSWAEWELVDARTLTALERRELAAKCSRAGSTPSAVLTDLGRDLAEMAWRAAFVRGEVERLNAPPLTPPRRGHLSVVRAPASED